MHGIHWSEFACSLSSIENFGDAAKQRTKILFHNLLKMVGPAPTRAHHFALHDSGIKRMTRNVIEVRAGVCENLLARREIAGQHFADTRNQPSKYLIEHRPV